MQDIFPICLTVCATVIGYYGSFCNISCPPGTFGIGCAGICSLLCPTADCHHKFGCLPRSSSVFQTTDSGSNQILACIQYYLFIVAVVYSNSWLFLVGVHRFFTGT